ncbi:MAG: tripartite tricarboxylate transporter substrate binding protein BugD, partial [Burkholderiales bacterium]
NLADIPTLDEQGLTGFDMVVFTALFAPKNLPKPVMDRLVGGLQAVINDAEMKAHVGRTGGIFATREQASPAGLQALVKTEVEKWVPLLRSAGVQPE